MRRLVGFVGALVTLTVGVASAQVYVNPYVRRDGSYVPGHMRTLPDGNRFNNWSTRPNVNPYTGRMGTESSYPTTRENWGRSYGTYGYGWGR